MPPVQTPSSIVRFGTFEADLKLGELRKSGVLLKLQGQPFRVLALMLERPGELVTRDDLRKALWSNDTFVDFDHGLNTIINTLREVLGDSASNPRFIKTLPRHGYRFIAPVQSAPSPQKGSSSRPNRIAALVGLAVIAAVLVSVLVYREWPWADPSRSPTVTPLTSYTGQEQDPAFHPDGRQVAFSWNGEAEDNYDIYVVLVGSDARTRLTVDPAEDFSPAWSPDGTRIAFLRRLSGAQAAIMSIPSIGGAEEQLGLVGRPREVRSVTPGPFLVWSNDGRRIIYGGVGNSGDLAGLSALSLETGKWQRLTLPPKEAIGDGGPAISPDGAKLLFHRILRAGVSEIRLLALSGNMTAGEEKVLVPTGDWNTSPVWTASGSEILFSSGPHRSPSLFRMGLSGGATPKRLDYAGTGAFTPAVARSGNRIVFQRLTADQNIWRLELAGPGRGAGIPGRLIASTQRDMAPRYSPDGTKIAFESERSGNREIWVSNIDGSNPVRITDLRGRGLARAPAWSPDASRVAYTYDVSERSEIWVAEIRTRVARPLVFGTGENSSPCWSRDGAWVYFTSTRGGDEQIWKVAAGGGEPLQVTKAGGAGPRISPNGDEIYYAKRVPGKLGWSLYRMPLGGGEETFEVAMPPASAFHGWPLFEVTSEGVYFPGEGGFIDFFEFRSGATRHVVKAPGTGFSLSPDGRALAYAQVDLMNSDLFLLEPFR